MTIGRDYFCIATDGGQRIGNKCRRGRTIGLMFTLCADARNAQKRKQFILRARVVACAPVSEIVRNMRSVHSDGFESVFEMRGVSVTLTSGGYETITEQHASDHRRSTACNA